MLGPRGLFLVESSPGKRPCSSFDEERWPNQKTRSNVWPQSFQEATSLSAGIRAGNNNIAVRFL